jgi:hypothetical protein
MRFQPRDIADSPQRAFKGETCALLCQAIQFLQEQAARGDRGVFRPQRRQTGGDQVGIDEVDA